MARRDSWQRGFSLLEMLVATGIFLVICAAMFQLLHLSQQKYSSETQLTAAYQDARLAMDQIVRDVNASGFPAVALFSVVPTSSPSSYANGPVAWSPNYPLTPCTVGSGGSGTCATPGDYDLIVETRVGTDTYVSWIWYHLDGTTLYRTVVPKTAGDPLSAVSSSGAGVAFLANVMNNPPGGPVVPIFQYNCPMTTGSGTLTVPCTTPGANNGAKYISDINITLIVRTPQPDLQTQAFKLVELNGRGHGANPVN